jgi:hypothetical protein
VTACGCRSLSGEVIGFEPRTGQFVTAAAGLGKTYPITLPVVGPTTVDIPVDAIVHDAVGALGRDLWQRFASNWYWFAGAALLAGTWVAVRRKR